MSASFCVVGRWKGSSPLTQTLREHAQHEQTIVPDLLVRTLFLRHRTLLGSMLQHVHQILEALPVFVRKLAEILHVHVGHEQVTIGG